MFDYHKKSPWFAEKYDPSEDMVALRKRVRKEGWKGRISRFILELDEGQHDPDSTVEKMAEGVEPEPLSKVEDPIVDEVKPAKQEEDDAGFGMDAEDEHQEDTKVDNTGKATNDGHKNSVHNTVSVMPEGNEVLIRTIPPDIGRVKLEEVCILAICVDLHPNSLIFLQICTSIPGFIHLALAEPQQRRNFYRAGWIRFQDGADMEAAVRELGEKKVRRLSCVGQYSLCHLMLGRRIQIACDSYHPTVCLPNESYSGRRQPSRKDQERSGSDQRARGSLGRGSLAIKGAPN